MLTDNVSEITVRNTTLTTISKDRNANFATFRQHSHGQAALPLCALEGYKRKFPLSPQKGSLAHPSSSTCYILMTLDSPEMAPIGQLRRLAPNGLLDAILDNIRTLLSKGVSPGEAALLPPTSMTWGAGCWGWRSCPAQSDPVLQLPLRKQRK